MLVVCEIFPQFGPIIDLAGATVTVALNFVFPIWCYLKLFPDTKLWKKLFLWFIMVFVCLGSIASTVANIWNFKDVFHQLYFAQTSNSTSKGSYIYVPF